MHRQAGLASEGQEVAPAPDRHGQQGAGLLAAGGTISGVLSPWAFTFLVFSGPW